MTRATDLTDFERRVLAKTRWRLYLYFFVGQVLVQLDKTNIGFAQLTMSRDLSLTAEAFGFASGTFSLAAVFMQVPAAKFFQALGARRWLTATMVLWGFSCMAEGFVANERELVFLRFLLGVFEAGFFPGAIILVNMWFTGNRHGRALGIMQLGTATSGIVGGPFAGWMLGKTLFGLAGWRNLFLWEGAATVVFALLALIVLYDNAATAAWLNPNEREFLAGYLSENRRQTSSKHVLDASGLFGVLVKGRVWVLVLSSFGAGWVYSTFSFFLPTLLKTAGHGLSIQAVGLLAVGPYVIQALVSVTWGAHSDRHQERHWHLVSALAVAGTGILLYPALSKQPLLAMLCLVMVQGGNAGFLVIFWSTVGMVIGKQTLAPATALIQGGSQLGGFFGPVVFGLLMDASKGNASLGLYEAVTVIALNFLIMNIFFLHYKAAQRSALLVAE